MSLITLVEAKAVGNPKWPSYWMTISFLLASCNPINFSANFRPLRALDDLVADKFLRPAVQAVAFLKSVQDQIRSSSIRTCGPDFGATR